MASSTSSTLFHCRCTPQCIDFCQTYDEISLMRDNQGKLLIDTDVHGEIVPTIINNTNGHNVSNRRGCQSKYNTSTDDSKVCYEFNMEGFYNEILVELKANAQVLNVAYTRAQRWLKHEQQQHPDLVYGIPHTYEPYYPTHYNTPYIPSSQYLHAEDVAKAVVAPAVREASKQFYSSEKSTHSHPIATETLSMSAIKLPARETYLNEVVSTLTKSMSIVPETFNPPA